MKIGIGIPTLNRYDLLKEALDVYREIYQGVDFIILDNGHQNIKKEEWFNIIETDYNYGVSKSWNTLINELQKRGCTHQLIFNDDIIFDKNIKQILEFIKNKPYSFYRGEEFSSFSAFLINNKILEIVGIFDIIFYPAYYEDNDYTFRMQLANIDIIKHPFFNPMKFSYGNTSKKYPELYRLTGESEQKYQIKWGANPNKEIYNIPYNNQKEYGGPFIIKHFFDVKNLVFDYNILLSLIKESKTILEINTLDARYLKILAVYDSEITTIINNIDPFIINLIEAYRTFNKKIKYLVNQFPEKFEYDLLIINQISNSINIINFSIKKYIVFTDVLAFYNIERVLKIIEGNWSCVYNNNKDFIFKNNDT